MHLYDRLRNAVATTKKSLLKRRDDAASYAKTLPTRAKVRAAITTSRLGDTLVSLAAKLHEATTETKRQQWRRHIREWRLRVRAEELALSDLAKQGSYRINVQGKGVDSVGSVGAATIPSPHFHEFVQEVAEKTGVSVAAIKHHMTGGKPSSSSN